jgi:putative intracellular protease/amidase
MAGSHSHYVVTDGHLITGQNATSSELTARTLLAAHNLATRS